MQQKIRMLSTELQDPFVLHFYMRNGYQWIKMYNDRSYETIVRNPTVGRVVEIYKLYEAGSVAIDSPKGRKLLSKLCYF